MLFLNHCLFFVCVVFIFIVMVSETFSNHNFTGTCINNHGLSQRRARHA